MQQLGSTQNDKPIGLAVSSTSEIVIAGSTPSQWFLAKYNSGGTLQWQRTFTTAVPGAIALTSGGQIVAVTAAGDYLEQYSSSGTLLWRLPTTGAEFYNACCLTIDRSGNIIVGGGYSYIGPAGNVAKFTAGGSLIWRHDFGGFENADGTGVTTDAVGNVIAVGYSDVTNAYGIFDHLDIMAKWSPAGVHPIGDIDTPLIAWMRTARFCGQLPQPQDCCGKGDDGEEVSGGFFVSCGDATELLEPGEAALDQLTFLVEVLVERVFA